MTLLVVAKVEVMKAGRVDNVGLEAGEATADNASRQLVMKCTSQTRETHRTCHKIAGLIPILNFCIVTYVELLG